MILGDVELRGERKSVIVNLGVNNLALVPWHYNKQMINWKNHYWLLLKKHASWCTSSRTPTYLFSILVTMFVTSYWRTGNY